MRSWKFSIPAFLTTIFILLACSSKNEIPGEMQGIWYSDRSKDVEFSSGAEEKFIKDQGPRTVLKIETARGKIFKAAGFVNELGEEPMEWSDSFALKKKNKTEFYFKYGDRKVTIRLDENKELVVHGLSMRVFNPAVIKKNPEPVTSIFIKLSDQMKAALIADTINKNWLNNYELIMEDYFNKGNYKLSHDDVPGTSGIVSIRKNKDYYQWCFDYRPLLLGDYLESVVIENFINIDDPSIHNPFSDNSDTANRFVIDNPFGNLADNRVSVGDKSIDLSPYNVCTVSRMPTREGVYEYTITAKIRLANGSTKELRSKRKMMVRPY